MKRTAFSFFPCGHCRHPEFMMRAGGSLRMAEFPSYVGLIEHPEAGLILFDTGYDDAFFEATNTFPERLYRWATPVFLEETENVVQWLARLGHKPDDIKIVIISHFHGDHVSGLYNFPKAKLFCSKAGMKTVRTGSRFSRIRQGLLSTLVPSDLESRVTYFEACSPVILPSAFYPFTESADLLGDGSLLAIELPGHCPGHWGLGLRTGEDQYVFLVADATWSLPAVEDNALPPWLTTALLGDTKEYKKTFVRLHQIRKDRPDTAVLPSHCPLAAKRFGINP